MGMRVTVQVELAVVEGRKLRFKLECQDEKEITGRDFDERAVIDPARFLAPLEKKAAG
jgi:fluoroacetyl-CoA thioesterase